MGRGVLSESVGKQVWQPTNLDLFMFIMFIRPLAAAVSSMHDPW